MYRAQNSKNFKLEAAMKFLAEYSFIYEIPNVDLFVENILETIPHEWRDAILNLTLNEIRKVPYGYFKQDWPETLLRFTEKANELAKYRYHYQPESKAEMMHIEIPDFIKRRTPSKKLYEITNMAAIVQKLSENYNCGIVIDIGSGLGYLDQIIHYNFGLTTIGFESELEKSINAKQRVSLGECQKNIHHVNQRIEDTVECKNIIENAIKEIRSNRVQCACGEHRLSSNVHTENVIMVGLHSCGDLMQSMMKLFCQIPEIKVFSCVGCCYHKLDLSDFPMSNIGKQALSSVKLENSRWNISTTGLRLGCQTTRDFWAKQTDEDFVYREKCLAYRAIMQCFLQKENLVWAKHKRHLIKRNVGLFEEFAASSLDAISLNGLLKEDCLDRLNKLFEEKRHLFQHIKVLSLLQALLQPIWESVIIKDRVAYFQQNGIQSDILVVCEESVTPRNLIVYGIKA